MGLHLAQLLGWCWRVSILLVVAAASSSSCHGFPSNILTQSTASASACGSFSSASHHLLPQQPYGDRIFHPLRRDLRLDFATKETLSFCDRQSITKRIRGGEEVHMAEPGENEVEAEPGDDEAAVEEDIFSRRGVILGFAVLSLGLTTALAATGTLPGPLFSSGGEIIPYSNAYLGQDVGVTLLTTGLGYALAKGITTAFEAGYLSSKDSRKLIHTLSAPLYILFWPLFSPATGSQAFAALVPMLNAVRLFLASTGKGESSLAMAVSRSGNLNEALGGPFIYVCILFACIVAFWRGSAIGLVALCTMAVGDGLADLIGRRFGKNNQWPGLQKSVAGSTAFWIGSTFAIVGILQWMQYWNCITFATDFTTTDLWIRAAVIGLATAALELVPIGDDNYSVPLAGAILGMLLFPVVV